MTTELYWLTLTALMTALFWVPYVLNRMVMNGLSGTLAGGAPDSSSLSLWAQRAIRAHTNAVEVTPAGMAGNYIAVVVYFFARLLHFVVYSAGVPAARTLTFTAGWLAQIAIIASVLRWI